MKPSPSPVATIVACVLIIIGVFLVVRAIPYILTAEGHCLLWNQPSILLGSSPSFTTDLACVGVQ